MFNRKAKAARLTKIPRNEILNRVMAAPLIKGSAGQGSSTGAWGTLAVAAAPAAAIVAAIAAVPEEAATAQRRWTRGRASCKLEPHRNQQTPYCSWGDTRKT